MSYDELRTLAATNPRSARAAIGLILDGGSDQLEQIIEYASAPGEGRIRQLLANVVRTRKDRDRIAPAFLRWLEHETDEFARIAILAAVDGLDTSRWSQPRKDLPDLVDTYRYVADRLCHRVRNAIPSSFTRAQQIARAAGEAPEPVRSGLVALAAQLTDDLRSLGRIVEFDENDEHFQWRRLVPMEWLPMYARVFAERNGALKFVWACDDAGAASAPIMGTQYHLETLFWNMFKNAQQAVEGPVNVITRASLVSGNLIIDCEDNGPGFPEVLTEGAFEDRVSTKGIGRGRGLLEMADAARRMSGSVRLVRDRAGVLRVQIALPVVHS